MCRFRFILPLASFLVLSAVFINPACGQTGNSRAASGRTAQQGGGGQGQCQKGMNGMMGTAGTGSGMQNPFGQSSGGMQNPFGQGTNSQSQNRYQQAMMMQQMMYYQMMMQQYYLQNMMQNPYGQNTQAGGTGRQGNSTTTQGVNQTANFRQGTAQRK